MDPLANMLTQIKNAQAVRKDRVVVPSSKMKAKVAAILKDMGYVGAIERRTKKGNTVEHEYLDIALRYYDDGHGAISGIRIMSRPSRHLYIKSDEIKPVRSGHGVAVISTSKGIMSSKDARKEKLGGEVLFEIW